MDIVRPRKWNGVRRMQYLKSYKTEFSHRVRHGDLSLYLHDGSAADILQPIAELIGMRSSERLRRCVTRCLSGARSSLFVKTVEIDSLPSRLRATFGVQRRGTGHIWPVAELINSIEASRRGAPVPRVMGFGYQRRGLRLVRELFLLSELLDSHVNGLHWLQEANGDIEPFLHNVFALFLQLHEREIFHLDLWAANVMLDPAHGGDLRVVDLENCYIGAMPYFSEALGFQFGFFYFRFVKQHISEARYDQLVAQALTAYEGLDRQRFDAIYSACKHRQISRKKRRLLILQGVLRTK